MRAIKEKSSTNYSPNSGSTKRLHEYYKRLLAESTDRVFDDKAVAVLMRYAFLHWVAKLKGELKYLKNLRDAEGRPFCRSMGKYSDVEEQVAHFKQKDKPSFMWNENMQHAMKVVTARYPKGLTMLEYTCDKDIYDAVTDWSTSAGFIGIETGLRKKRDYLTNIYSVALQEEDKALSVGRYTTPIMLASRTQGSGAYDEEGKRTHTCKHKKRFVSADGLFSVISACRVGQPLTNFLKYYKYSAIGKDDQMVTDQILYWKYECQGFISLDYSKYDSTIPQWLLRAAFKVLRSCFIFRNAREEKLFKVIEESFITKSLALPEGNVLVTHGTPSGNRLTSIINGICNELITETWMKALDVKGVYMIMGDDNLIYLKWNGDKKSLLTKVATYIYHNFGIIVNAEKSSSGSKFQDPEFMSRFWGASGPWRWVGEVVSLLAYPERYRDYKKTLLTPELVVLSYILAYRKTMREIMDVDRFLRENEIDILKLAADVNVRKELPYNVRTYVEAKLQGSKHVKKCESLIA